MSRRKQTNPNKVDWDHLFGGIGECELPAQGAKTDLPGQSEDQGESIQGSTEKENFSCESEDEMEHTANEWSSLTSDDDHLTRVASETVESESKEDPEAGAQSSTVQQTCEEGKDFSQAHLCPLCQLECSSRDQLIAHLYQHTAMVGSAKSYVCPVCGRALSSPGSLGRHLLIHSEDQLSNCAVCGAKFTTHGNFSSEKVSEFIKSGLSNSSDSEGASSSVSEGQDVSPPVYPAGILLVCYNCAAYRQLAESQTPVVRKWAIRRQREPMEARLVRLERERRAKKNRRDSETPEERELRRMRDREAKRLQRMQETDEQRARRLQRDREAMRQKRANETPEKRQARLIREREAKRIKRRLEKMDMTLRAQFSQDPAAVAALAAEMSWLQQQLPGANPELDNRLFMKLT
ncbi:zinc finger protein 821 isoform X2 [Latimeria chalumnae]|uniref:zinc finger protein 821 isoform X2 n=1 Tax=Latimeria chalumnae TaxID=7897 RepID=UPI0006D92F10|nr:PREDICTED: zinc finger protein 821 isoform X2 [Latimeria chalumnae]|eukprot:XP_014352610.1 PREDICTED: zinc finger protein 821 isoform X2 [Latimeria chalumnae]